MGVLLTLGLSGSGRGWSRDPLPFTHLCTHSDMRGPITTSTHEKHKKVKKDLFDRFERNKKVKYVSESAGFFSLKGFHIQWLHAMYFKVTFHQNFNDWIQKVIQVRQVISLPHLLISYRTNKIGCVVARRLQILYAGSQEPKGIFLTQIQESDCRQTVQTL